MGGANTPHVLRRVPVQITDGDGYLTYQEMYEGNKAKGFVLLVDENVTIWGEDADREGFSELFWAQIVNNEDGRGWREGVILMEGDLGAPTAYRIIVRAVTEDADLPWEEFVTKYQATYDINLPNNSDKPNIDDVEEETNTPLQDYVDKLAITKFNVDLQF